MRLDDIVEIGYEKSAHNFGGYEIWMKDDSRILFDQHNNKVIAEYSIKDRKGKEFHNNYVGENEKMVKNYSIRVWG